MITSDSHKQAIRLWLAGGVAALLTAGAGLCLLLEPIGGGLTRSSFDLPFALRGNLEITNAAIIYLDEVSHEELNQPILLPWDRSLHARLIDNLTAQGAKAIVFDILFTEPSANPDADAQLARAIKQSGRVIFCGNLNLLGGDSSKNAPIYELNSTNTDDSSEEYPYEPFRVGTVAWGNDNLNADPDYGIRSFFPTVKVHSQEIPWMPAAAAKFAGAPESAVHSDNSESRWLNYYGPPGSFPSVSYFVAIVPEGPPPGFFKDKIVFVGAKLSADFTGKGKDEFLTPYAYLGKGFAPGVEIHATATLNFLQHNWLNRLSPKLEQRVVLLFGVLAGVGLIRLLPMTAALLTVLVTVLVAVMAHWMAWHWHLWFAWLILVCELWIAMLCSVSYNSLQLFVEKKLLEQSLSAHLSPALVKRLLNDPNLRRRGGAKQEVSMMFTDIEGFSRISEAMLPDDLVNLLNQYFETALQCIHETDGTVMDLVGDAIFAIWNAPVEQPDHRERAFETALKLQAQLAEFNAAQQDFPLRTRVGLHTGVVCVGNIGSERRFDYTAIGENTNLASRLEGLNKYFGTRVLASRDIQSVMEGKLTSRLVGLIRVKGFLRAVEIHELVGARDIAEATRMWRDKFSEALTLFQRREFDAAGQAFQETIQLRKDGDGPSQFYLNQIAELRVHPPPPDWIGRSS